MQIVRVTRIGGAFHAHFVSEADLKDSLKKPAVRGEAILDGLFAQAVAIVEADGDRLVYQTIWETLGDEKGLEIHFAPVGGTGGILDACKLYKRLHIPVVVITDLDTVTDLAKFREMATLLSDDAKAQELVRALAPIVAAITNIPPEIGVDEVKKRFAKLAVSNFDWQRDDDMSLQKLVRELANALDRVRRLKRGGLAALPLHIRHPLENVLSSAEGIGIFIVPIGELEGWLAKAGIKASKQNKWAWATEAAGIVRQMGAQSGDVWDFMRRVGLYLAKYG
jgi:hypothetical protein